MKDQPMWITQQSMKDFMFNNLIAAGLAPNDSDLDIITDIFFDYLIHVGIMDEAEVIYYDEDDEEYEDEE